MTQGRLGHLTRVAPWLVVSVIRAIWFVKKALARVELQDWRGKLWQTEDVVVWELNFFLPLSFFLN